MTTAVEPVYTLGELIRKARTDAGLEQLELAERVGVSRQLVSKWERNKSEPTIRQFRALAAVTHAEWLWWVARDSNPEPADSALNLDAA